MELTFSQLEFEGNADTTITVHDGQTLGAPLLGTFRGGSSRRAIPPITRSTGPDMFVRFTRSGNAVAPDIFFADWAFVNSLQEICSSRMVITDRHGTIQGNNHSPIGGTSAVDCTVTLHAPTLSSILLSFTRLELEHCATMEIYDGFGESADLLALFTGSAEPPSISSTGQDIHVRFTQTPEQRLDASCLLGKNWGFAVDWDFLGEGFDICSPPTAVLTGQAGVLHDDAPDGDVDCSAVDCDFSALGAAGYVK